MEKYIHKTVSANTAFLWLNRPQVGNALNLEMIREITNHVKEIELDKQIRFVIFKAKGQSFCTGADLVWMASSTKLSAEENFNESMELAELFEAIFFSSKIYFAVVKGACYGGGIGLASACDFVLAHESAIFSFSEVKLGLIPATIAPFIVNRIGFIRAKTFMLTGNKISADDALKLRLVDEVFKTDNEETILTNYLGILREGGPVAQQGIKKLINSWSLSDYREGPKKQTAEIIARARISDEGKEGIKAFLEKRKPDWNK